MHDGARVCGGQIREQRRREVGRLGAMIPYYTGTVALMVASPIMASVASFCVYARVVPAEQFSPGRIFSSLALFGLLKPALEGLPFVLVEVHLPCPAHSVCWLGFAGDVWPAQAGAGGPAL